MELVAGKGGQGRLALEGLSLELIELDRAVYIKGNRRLLPALRRAHGRAAAAGEVAEGIRAERAAGVAGVADRASSKLIDGTLAGHGALSRAGRTTIDGHSVVGVRDAAGGGTLYVASTGAPYPIEIVRDGTGANRAGRVVFDRWNQPVTIQAPPDPINIKQLHRNPVGR